jgi:DNA adenine methylase
MTTQTLLIPDLGENSQVFPNEKSRQAPPYVVNVASVKHRSPFRYPGGKTWLVPTIRDWLDSFSHPPRIFVEPFAGGGIVGLNSLFDGRVEKLILAELDSDVAAVWETILNGGAQKLAKLIVSFEMQHKNVVEVLNSRTRSLLQRAFKTILKNRVQRGGILAEGASLMKHGENGKGLSSRWYAETLEKRILDIAKLRDYMEFVHGDGIEILRQMRLRKDAIFFIDPPYTKAARRLYAHSEIDHANLFRVAQSLKGDFLMTYDDTEEIRELASRHGFQMRRIAMKNTHGRDLGWLKNGIDRS